MTKNINKLNKGFTIVELLVVIVVIGILAAITIVSYTGITAKANTAKALSNAQSVQNVADIWFAENSTYPDQVADFLASTTAKLPATTVVTAGLAGNLAAQTNITAANGGNTVSWSCTTAACASATGARIVYYDFSAGSAKAIYIGNATEASTFFAPAA